MDLDFVSVHKNAKKELGQYPAILTEQAWSITNIYYMSGSVSGQDEAKHRALIGYPRGQDGAILTARDRPLCPRGKKKSEAG